MRKIVFGLLFFQFSAALFAQKPTDEINISGLIEKPAKITYAELLQSPTVALGDFKVTNHAGEFRREYKNVKGVALLDFLQKINITAPTPRQLSEYYLVFKASDDYTVVYSWNEIFNTDTGKTLFVVTEADGQSYAESKERILLITTKDYKTGRRHVKGLSSIEIKRL
jgi:hypothetical protein